jgi:hypothetical protein
MKQLTRVAAALSMLLLAGTSRADLNRVGPANVPAPPGHGFPAWYQDLGGLTLDFCLPDANDPGQLQQTACLLVGAGLPTPPYAFPTSFPDEVFYYRAVSAPLDTSNPAGGTNKAILVLALEGAFATGGAAAGQQITFTRIRITAGLPHPGTWTVTHPYGIETFVVDSATGARDIFFSEDVGVAPGTFAGALSSRVGPFLQASTVAGGAPKAPVVLNGASFLSDGVALEQLTGSPFGTNYFELCGPYDGTTVSCRSTPLFSLTGRVHAGLIGSPLQVDRATYSRSAAGAQVDVSANAKAGIGQAAPVLTAAASTVSPVLLAGPTTLGEWYGQGIPVPADAIPSLLTVINSSDVPPTAVNARVTDMVTVKSATYAGGTLTVIATSSDKGDATVQAPVLGLEGMPSAAATLSSAADPAETTFTIALAVPPPTVRVSSSVGGQGQMDVVMGAAAPFAPGAPLAVDDNAVATAGGSLVVIPVLLNDVQSSLVPVLPAAILAAPNLGTATANLDGTVSYTPSAVAGTATFQYTVSNSAGKSNVATVTVAVGPSLSPSPVAVNDPSAGTLSVSTGSPLVINVLANDSGNGGTLDPASILVTAVTGGTAVANAGGTVTYTAGGVAGNFGFTYTVANTNGNRSNPATVAVTVLSPEVITLKGAQCQRQGTQWVVSGSSTVLSGTMTLFNVSPVPAAPTTAQVIANVPIAAGKWQYNVKGGPACVSPISLQSTGGGRLNGVVVTIK